ncbi:hypothetical protein G7Y89_g11442 [Cudoniella acicularis]|uniref:Uncharacterized protein n=1 Tax=Cudoniella acicularis TaxID=354080 RepID=A0A8H4W044_9HELO|nr:hypothetical protein G7Y89_g11442 [Cudoniella acicularis]
MLDDEIGELLIGLEEALEEEVLIEPDLVSVVEREVLLLETNELPVADAVLVDVVERDMLPLESTELSVDDTVLVDPDLEGDGETELLLIEGKPLLLEDNTEVLELEPIRDELEPNFEELETKLTELEIDDVPPTAVETPSLLLLVVPFLEPDVELLDRGAA